MPYPNHKDHDSYEEMRQESEREDFRNLVRQMLWIHHEHDWPEEVTQQQADGMDSTMGKLS